jgi:hypothetical protein
MIRSCQPALFHNCFCTSFAESIHIAAALTVAWQPRINREIAA